KFHCLMAGPRAANFVTWIMVRFHLQQDRIDLLAVTVRRETHVKFSAADDALGNRSGERKYHLLLSARASQTVPNPASDPPVAEKRRERNLRRERERIDRMSGFVASESKILRRTRPVLPLDFRQVGR